MGSTRVARWAGSQEASREMMVRTKAVAANMSGSVALTPKEYAILELLFLRRGVVHSKPAIVNQIYGAEDGPALRTLDVIVCKLRKKLAFHGAPDLVATVWGSGLILRELPELVPGEPLGEAELVAA